MPIRSLRHFTMLAIAGLLVSHPAACRQPDVDRDEVVPSSGQVLPGILAGSNLTRKDTVLVWLLRPRDCLQCSYFDYQTRRLTREPDRHLRFMAIFIGPRTERIRLERYFSSKRLNPEIRYVEESELSEETRRFTTPLLLLMNGEGMVLSDDAEKRGNAG